MGDMSFKSGEFQGSCSKFRFTCFHAPLRRRPGIGRIDKILGPYLKRILIRCFNSDEARKSCFLFIKGVNGLEEKHNGFRDAQHYQNIILAEWMRIIKRLRMKLHILFLIL